MEIKKVLLEKLKGKIKDSVVTSEEQRLFRMNVVTELSSLEEYSPSEIDTQFYKYYGVKLNLEKEITSISPSKDLEQALENIYSNIYKLIQYPNIEIAKINFIEECIGKYNKSTEKSEKIDKFITELIVETNFWENKDSSLERSPLISKLLYKDCNEIEIFIKNYISTTVNNLTEDNCNGAKKNYDVNKILLLSDLGELAYVKNGDKSELAIIPKDISYIENLAQYTELETGNYLYVENNKMLSGKILLLNKSTGNFTLENKGFKAVEEYLNKAGFDLDTTTLKIAIKTYIKLVLTKLNLYNHKDLAETIAKKVSGVSSPSGALTELKSLIQTELGSILLEVENAK